MNTSVTKADGWGGGSHWCEDFTNVKSLSVKFRAMEKRIFPRFTYSYVPGKFSIY